MKTVVLTFDRLPASLLGCYGNEWVETPSFNRLAAQAMVFPSAFAEIPGPAGAAHPWWTGHFEFFRQPTDAGRTTIFNEVSAAGKSCRFVSERDDGLPPAGIEHSPATAPAAETSSGFERVDGQDGLDASHSSVPFARLINRATEILQEPFAARPDLLWLHSRGVPSPWLAPEFFSGLYLDELEDQQDSESTGRDIADALIHQIRQDPDLTGVLFSDHDHDEESMPGAQLIASELGDSGTRISRYVFAGYVSLIDHLLGPLITTIENQADMWLIVTAAGGVTFGERPAFLDSDRQASQLAAADDDVSDTLTRVPLLVRPPGPGAFGTRPMRPVQSPDICRLIRKLVIDPPAEAADAVGWPELPGANSQPSADQRSPACEPVFHLGHRGTVAIRSGEWMLTVPDGLSLIRKGVDASEIDQQAGLYLQPNDRWNLNSVARLQPELASELFQRLHHRLSGSSR